MMTRRQYSAAFKLRVAQEVLETGNGKLVARRRDLGSSMVNRWARLYRQFGETAFNGQRSNKLHATLSIDPTAHRALERENGQLKKLLAEKELKAAILHDLVKKVPSR